MADEPTKPTIEKMSKEFNPLFLKINIIDMDDIIRTPHLMNICRSLSLRGESGMNASLNEYTELIKERSVDACGIFTHYLDVPVAWLLYTYEDDCVCFRGSNKEAASHIYVHSAWRRRGIGTRLIQLAARMAAPDTLRVYEHNESQFFRPLIRGIENVEAI